MKNFLLILALFISLPAFADNHTEGDSAERAERTERREGAREGQRQRRSAERGQRGGDGERGMRPDNSAKKEAMQKLAFLAGEWEGKGSMQRGPRTMEFEGEEEVEYEAGGMVLVVEGEHTTEDSDGRERVIHEALGVISFNEETGKYDFVSHLANGRSGGYEAELVAENQLAWSMEMDTPRGTMMMRYTITVDGDKWAEIGEMSRDGGETWNKTFEMNLVREDDDDDDDDEHKHHDGDNDGDTHGEHGDHAKGEHQ